MLPIKDYSQIRADLLRDTANLRPEAQLGDDSDYAVRASATAAAVEGLYQHQQYLAREMMPDTAVDWLARHGFIHGIQAKSANRATGTLLMTGSVGAVIPLGTEAKSASGISVVSTADATIGLAGTAVVTVQAAVAGISGNLAASLVLTLVSTPTNVDSTALVIGMSGGAEAETTEEVRARLLDVIRQPPAGGNQYDYPRWALEIPGVGFAWCFPKRRGIGTVDVVFLAEDRIIPDSTLVATVQAHLDDVSPVGAIDGVLALAPTPVAVAISATLVLKSGFLLADVTPYINSALAALFDTYIPGDTVRVNKLVSLMLAMDGIADASIALPVANVTTLVDESHVQLPTLGTVTLA